ncbi:glycosyltransferase [Subtercola sp. Z020]|uniref:glycosyltransferase family 2 protein n=1 Tax=Subtercola sp. Z020 TaxID=2080582 RepID=UPI001E543569|nr:glycosyltransferase [Subtercola sp. Z020]
MAATLGRSRKGSQEWGAPRVGSGAGSHELHAPAVDVLIPTLDRVTELAVTLAGLAAQDAPAFRVVIGSQAAGAAPLQQPGIRSMIRVLEAQGRPVRVLESGPPRGMAAQRQFLLEHAVAEFVLYLDDDVWLEPGQLVRLVDAIRVLDCGFVGAAVQGLSYLGDHRPAEQAPFERWAGAVHPEHIRRGSPGFERWRLHNAANLAHIAAGLALADDEWVAYKVAWIGGCVLYRRSALLAVGGFDFGPDLPRQHAGEDVAAEWRVMQAFGGAGILPSGAVHLEAPTTLPNRSVDVFDLLWPEQHRARAPTGFALRE